MSRRLHKPHLPDARPAWLLAGWLVLVSTTALAQEGTSPDSGVPMADGALSLRSDVWNGSRQLSRTRRVVASASAWGRGRLDLGEKGQILANGWLREQTAASDPGRHARLRELYWRQNFGPIELKLGRQIVAWGRADGLNPTDNLSPRDYRLLTPQDADQRHGSDAVQLTTALPVGALSWFWFPHGARHLIPLEALPGVVYREERPRGSQWAVRWEVLGAGAVDAALSYFDGADALPDLTAGSLSANGMEVVLRHQRQQVLGADLSWADGRTVWRTEMAFTRTASAGQADFSHKKPQLWWVGGAERDVGQGSVTLQGTWLHVSDFGNPDRLTPAGPLRELAWRQLATSGQSAADQAGLLWRWTRRLRNDSLTLETSGVALWPMGGDTPRGASGLMRAGANFELDDAWQLQLGGERFYGPPETRFGQLRRNSLVYVQLRRGL